MHRPEQRRNRVRESCTIMSNADPSFYRTIQLQAFILLYRIPFFTFFNPALLVMGDADNNTCPPHKYHPFSSHSGIGTRYFCVNGMKGLNVLRHSTVDNYPTGTDCWIPGEAQIRGGGISRQ